MTKLYAFIAAVVAIVVLGGTWWMSRPTDDDQFAQCRSTAIGTGAASIGGPLDLVDENGTAVTDANIFVKPTLLYFGYTFCPDVCPLDNTRNAEALDLIQADGYDAQMAFITIDPERDGTEELRDFTNYIHDDMIGLTGTPEQVKAASLAYKTYYKKQDSDDPEFYLVDHSTFTYLVLPEVGFVEFFKRDDSPEKIAESTECFINATK